MWVSRALYPIYGRLNLFNREKRNREGVAYRVGRLAYLREFINPI